MLAIQLRDELIVGTRLVVRRRGYAHHGIYSGNGRVIHYAGRIRYPQGRIEEVGLEEFASNRPIDVGTNPGRLRGREIVRRARSRLGECSYDLFSNNCEHFCNWCQDGVARSPQVDALPGPTRTLLRAAETLVVVARHSRCARRIGRDVRMPTPVSLAR